jgi:hypothetical protein
MAARIHHFVPQCYLKGFTRNRKKPRLFVVDRKEASSFFTHPKNVAAQRDFHRVEVNGIPTDALENAFSGFESELTKALLAAVEMQTIEGEVKIYLLNLMTLISVKNPRHRESMRDFRARVANAILDLSLASRERDGKLR